MQGEANLWKFGSFHPRMKSSVPKQKADWGSTAVLPFSPVRRFVGSRVLLWKIISYNPISAMVVAKGD